MGEGGLHSKHTIVILTVGIDNSVTQIAFAQHNHFPHLSQLHPLKKIFIISFQLQSLPQKCKMSQK